MTLVSETETRPGEQLRVRLRSVVGGELERRGLSNVEDLASALGVVPGVARSLLRRSNWTVDEATWIVEKLNLPIAIQVTRSSHA